jgi:hypothetical protein
MRWICGPHGRDEEYGIVLVAISEGERSLGSPGHRWENNIKMDLKKCAGTLWTAFIWLKIGMSGELL